MFGGWMCSTQNSFLLISHVQQDFICSFPREMSKGWPTLKMVGKAMAHPQMYSMCWKPANFSKDVLYWAAPRVQTKTMRVQSNKTKPIPGRQSALSLSQFIDQPKRCCNIKNLNKNRTQSRLGRRSSPSSREPHLPLIWTALSFPWFFKEGVTVSDRSWAQKQIYSGQNNHLSWSENGGYPKLWPLTNRKQI